MSTRDESQVRALFDEKIRELKDPDAALFAVYQAGRMDAALVERDTELARLSRGLREHQRHRDMIVSKANPHLAAVASLRGVHVWQIASVGKGDSIVYSARHEWAWILRNVERMSYPDIAFATGRADHTTAMHAVKMVEARIAEWPELRDELLRLGGAEPRGGLRVVGAAG